MYAGSLSFSSGTITAILASEFWKRNLEELGDSIDSFLNRIYSMPAVAVVNLLKTLCALASDASKE